MQVTVRQYDLIIEQALSILQPISTDFAMCTPDSISPNSEAFSGRKRLSRAEIATRIANGALLIIHDCCVLDVTSWAPIHPGGTLALLHFVGRDATDEIEAYHSQTALERMKKFMIGTVDIDQGTGWEALTPPIALGLVRHPDGVKGHWTREGKIILGDMMVRHDMASQNNLAPVGSTSADVITLRPAQLEPPPSHLDSRTERLRSKAYRDLKRRVERAGLFDRPGFLAGYGSDLARCTALGGTALALFFLLVHELSSRLTFPPERADGLDKWCQLYFWDLYSTSSHVRITMCS